MSDKCDLGIRTSYLLTMDSGSDHVQEDMFIGVRRNKIEIVAPYDSKKHKAKKFIDAKNKLVLPGFINGHTHLPMTLFRGLADDLPFKDWLFKVILPLEKKHVDPNFIQVGTELAALELIRFGVTTVCDMYFFIEVGAGVLDRAGLRAMITKPCLDFPTPDNPNADRSWFKNLDSILERYEGHSRLSIGLGPHAPYSCSDETITGVVKEVSKRGLFSVIHVSETQSEVEESFKKYHMSPVARLKKLGLFDHRCVIAHGVHLSDSDIEILAESKVGLIHNPESNMKLASGISPIPKILKAGIAVGLGTDGAASNNNLGLFHEMDTAAKLQKLEAKGNAGLTAYECLYMATLGGARALGLQDTIGSITVGKKADIAIIDLEYPQFYPRTHLASHLVYSACGMEVDTVICDGKILFIDNEYQTLDPAPIYKRTEKMRKLIGNPSL